MFLGLGHRGSRGGAGRGPPPHRRWLAGWDVIAIQSVDKSPVKSDTYRVRFRGLMSHQQATPAGKPQLAESDQEARTEDVLVWRKTCLQTREGGCSGIGRGRTL